MDYDVQLEEIYVNGLKTDTFPKKSDDMKFEKISCSNEANASFDEESWKLSIGNLSEASSCKIYFTSSKSLLNPPTGTFLSIGIILVLIIAGIFIVRKYKDKFKFFRV